MLSGVLLLLLFASLGVALLLVLLGFVLPSRLTVERSIVIDRPAERIFPWVAELRRWPQWTVWNPAEDPTLSFAYPGATTGLAGAMHWTARKLGAGSLIIREFTPYAALRYELRLPAHDTVVHGNIEFESAGNGTTRVRWCDEVELGGNPLKKLMGPLLQRRLGRAFERNLRGLRAAALADRVAGPGPE